MNKCVVKVKTFIIEDEMTYNNEIVLTYKIEYPQFKSSYYQIPIAMINQFYRNQALRFQRQTRTKLYKLAVEDYIYAIQNDFPIRVYEILVDYKITYNVGCIISLYYDKYEYTGGAHGNTTRYSQTYNLQHNGLIKLPQLFNCSLDYEKYILKIIREKIEEDPSIYFDDYEKLIVENFNENNFYCTPKGIVIYYQQYDIAPYSSGIREFLIPYTDCVIDPVEQCFPI